MSGIEPSPGWRGGWLHRQPGRPRAIEAYKRAQRLRPFECGQG